MLVIQNTKLSPILPDFNKIENINTGENIIKNVII